MTKAEILQLMNRMKTSEKSRESSSYTGMATVLNHLLWQKYAWEQEQLAEYNQKVNEYYEKYYHGKVTEEGMNQRLLDTANFDVENLPNSVNDFSVDPKNKYLYSVAKRINEADNDIYNMARLYLLIHFCVLLDMGMDISFLQKHKDEVNSKLAISRGKIQMYHKELIEEAGICIEVR